MPPWEVVFKVAWIPDEAAWTQVVNVVQENDRRRRMAG
jgi:hypothetical protein